jgi:signal transduction histidine kinase
MLNFSKKDALEEVEHLEKWNVLVVDDEKVVHDMTDIVLNGFSLDKKKLNLISAYSAVQAKKILSENSDIALVLLDVVMESDDAGLEVVKYIREELKNKDIRIIIRTGQAGIASEEKIVLEYDINDFKEKTELTNIKLFTTINSALKAYRDIQNVRELERKIYEQELKQNEEQKITEAKDAFLVLFSHELKTPLNAIINFSKYLYKHVEAGSINNIPIEKKAKLLKQIELSASQMLEDITSILELRKIKSTKLEYKMNNSNLEEMLNEVIHKHEVLAEEYNVSISLSYHCDESKILSDEYRLKQIFANVISNAIKYSKGLVHIEVNSLEDKYLVTVEDNGLGIKDVDKEKAFELFEQLDEDISTRNKKGTGVGLNFVKYLCYGLGIEYKLEDSKKLGGLCFKLFLGIKKA